MSKLLKSIWEQNLWYVVVRDFDVIEGGQDLEHGEVIELEWFSVDEVRRMALEGEIQEGRSAAVVLQFLHKNILW